MALSINRLTSVITIPQADLTLVSGILYELDADAFRLALKDIEDSVEGMVFPKTHNHNTQVTLSGVTYARTLEILSPYTVTFEDTGSPYTVRIVGANHNIADVTNYVSEVSLIVGNSAGLQAVATGSGLSGPQDQALTDAKNAAVLAQKLLRNKMVTDPADGKVKVYDDNGALLIQANVFEDAAGTQPYRGLGAERRERLT